MEQPETPPRELTLEEAVALAILLQKNEQLVEARELYRRVLDTAPNHPDALHYAGVLAHQQGHSDEAVELIERSLAFAPGRTDCYNNLGIIFQSTGKLQPAIDAYQHAIAIDPRPRSRIRASRRQSSSMCWMPAAAPFIRPGRLATCISTNTQRILSHRTAYLSSKIAVKFISVGVRLSSNPCKS